MKSHGLIVIAILLLTFVSCQQSIDGKKLGECSEFLIVGREPNQGDWVFNAASLKNELQKEATCKVRYGEIIKGPANKLYLELGKKNCGETNALGFSELHAVLFQLNQGSILEKVIPLANIRYNSDSSFIYYLIDLSDGKNRQALDRFPLQKIDIQTSGTQICLASIRIPAEHGHYFQSLLPCLENPQVLRHLSTGFYKY